MKDLIPVIKVLAALCLFIGCGGDDPAEDTPEVQTYEAEDETVQAASLSSDCPPVNGEGTVPPAIAIYSATFIVNDLEHVVRAGDVLQVSYDEELGIAGVSICVDSLSGDGGKVCVELAPVDQNGQDIVSEGRGTHTVTVTSGITFIPGPDQEWTVSKDWKSISIVVNHWPSGSTRDLSCAGGLCEHDDRLIVDIQQ